MPRFCRRAAFLFSLLLIWTGPAWSVEGMVSVKSSHGAKETADRFERIVKSKNLNVFARIDHAAGAKKIDKNLRPTEVLIFGNPQGGTPLMECNQSVGIDLPLKALVWEDASGQVWLGYNDPAYLVGRHKLSGCEKAAMNISKALAGIAKEVTSR
jgi:uncharacterized protein (DUF302 family)